MDYVVMGIIIVVALILISKKSKYFLHMVQLEKYEAENYKKWIKSNREKAYTYGINKEQMKKPLVFTQRARRLYRVNLLINLLFLLIMPIFYGLESGNMVSLLALPLLALLIYRQQADIMYLSNLIMLPIENRINMGKLKLEKI